MIFYFKGTRNLFKLFSIR